jgi:MFS transporter, OFA family, oxalate/formate antiporter
VAVGSLGVAMSIPGQTMGVSVFTDSLIEVLGLSRSLLSIAYLVGTIGSALILSYAGRVYDRYGSRVMAAASAIGLGAVLVVMTRIDTVAAALTHVFPTAWSWFPPFLSVSIGFFGMRFFGQGVLTMSSNNMVMKWFVRKRAIAAAIVGTVLSFTFSGAPRVLDALIGAFGWRGAWLACAVVVGIAFPLVVVVFYRDNPEQCGMSPDGRMRSRRPRRRRRTPQPTHPEEDFTLRQARRTFAFWVFGSALFLLSLYSTGLTFHIVSVFGEAGMTRELAVSIFLPASVIAVVIRLAAGVISDYIKLKYLLIGLLLGLLVSSISVIMLGPGIPVVAIIVGNGVSGGLFGLVATVTWPQYYGRSHLGSITGFIMALQVAGSAVGPYAFSLSLRLTNGYAATAGACLAAACVLIVASLRAERPREIGAYGS